MSAIATRPAPVATPAPVGVTPGPWKWTREQYYELDKRGFFDGHRVELIRGEIIEMSPINWPHVVCTSKVGDALRAAFSGIGRVIEQGPQPVFDSEPIPDVRVVAGKFSDYTDHPRNALIVVEVSDTTLAYDTTTKAELYATAGIADYWVLDLNGRQLHVFRDPQPHPVLSTTAYRTHLTLGPSDSVAPLAAPNTSILVSDLLP